MKRLTTGTVSVLVTLAISAMHIIWGYLVLNEPLILKVSSLYYLYWLFGEKGALFSGSLLLVVGFFGIFGLARDEFRWLLPQQFCLTVQLICILLVIYSGHYPDHYVPKGGRSFIFADQLPALLFSFSHIATALYLLRNPRPKVIITGV